MQKRSMILNEKQAREEQEAIEQVQKAKADAERLVTCKVEVFAVLEKHKCSLGAIASITPEGRIIAQPTIGLVNAA